MILNQLKQHACAKNFTQVQILCDQLEKEHFYQQSAKYKKILVLKLQSLLAQMQQTQDEQIIVDEFKHIIEYIKNPEKDLMAAGADLLNVISDPDKDINPSSIVAILLPLLDALLDGIGHAFSKIMKVGADSTFMKMVSAAKIEVRNWLTKSLPEQSTQSNESAEMRAEKNKTFTPAFAQHNRVPTHSAKEEENDFTLLKRK